MMVPAVLLVAVTFGCKPKSENPPAAKDDSGSTTTTEDTSTETVERPVLTSPSEAVDLDPAEGVVHVELVASPMTFEVAGEQVEGFAYNGQVPGPTIRVRTGDRLIVDLTNEIDTETTIHWHGVHVPWEMDGVTWMQDPVGVGETFRYEFVVEQTGTYWYHPHFDTDRQVDLGLYGVLVIEDPSDPVPDEELIVVVDSWGEYEVHDDEEEDASSEGHSHLEGTGLTWTVNGLLEPIWPLDGGAVARVRAVNASNTGYVALAFDGLRHIGSDQGLLPGLQTPDNVVLTPGDRADFEVLGASDFIVWNEPHSLQGGATYGDPVLLFDAAISDPGSTADPLTWPFDGAASVSPDPDYTDIVYVFQGDASSGTWMMNGEVYPDVTVEEAALDTESIIEVRNVSSSEHPFHLHGHGFEVLSTGGVASAEYTFEDTINVPIQSWVRLRLGANNPGDWMAHCHILPHAHGGMMTVLRVE